MSVPYLSPSTDSQGHCTAFEVVHGSLLSLPYKMKFRFLSLAFKALEGLASVLLCSLSLVRCHMNPHQLYPGLGVPRRHLGILPHRVFAWSLGETGVLDTGGCCYVPVESDHTLFCSVVIFKKRSKSKDTGKSGYENPPYTTGVIDTGS